MGGRRKHDGGGRTEQETIEKLQKASRIADQWATRHASVFTARNIN